MFDEEKRYTFDRVVRLVLTAGLCFVLFLLVRYLADVLLPFAIAVLLAYLLNPIVTLFAERTGRRWAGVGITLGGLGIVMVAILAVAIPIVTHQVGAFGRDLSALRHDLAASEEIQLPDHIDEVEDLPAETDEDDASADEAPETTEEATAPAVQPGTIGLTRLLKAWAAFREESSEYSRPERVARFERRMEGTSVGGLVDYLTSYLHSEEFKQRQARLLEQALGGGLTVIRVTLNTVMGMLGLIFILIFLVFLLLDYPSYQENWTRFLPPKYREGISGFLGEFNNALKRYLRGQFLVASSVGVLFCIGFSLIGLPMAIPMGIFIGALNMVPYLQIVGFVPAGVLALLGSIQSDTSPLASLLLLLLVLGAVQFIQDSQLTPRIMGRVTGLRPVSVLLGLLIWGKLLGFLGLVVAIPLTCLLIAYYRRVVLRHSKDEAKVVRE